MCRNLYVVSVALAIFGVPFLSKPVSAHHAVQAQFDQNNVATITGVMTRVMWINPHVRWFMDIKDENGSVTSWNISGAGPGGFRFDAWRTPDSRSVFNPADTGSPA